MSLENLRKLIIKHEGMELKPYRDTVGKWTIGVGRNLSDNGISRDEAIYMLERDLQRCYIEARTFIWWKGLDPVRQEVVICMLFNLGLTRLLKFEKFLGHMALRDFKSAAEEMLRSRWADQVGGRATELSLMLHDGKYLPE